MKDPINDENFLLFCAKHYETKYSTSTAEFQEDINRIKYIRRLLLRYAQTGSIKERLVLNHIIILSNVFTPPICSKILLFRLFDQAKYLKPFLVFLSLLPDSIENVGEFDVLYTDTIEMDLGLVEILRKL